MPLLGQGGQGRRGPAGRGGSHPHPRNAADQQGEHDGEGGVGFVRGHGLPVSGTVGEASRPAPLQRHTSLGTGVEQSGIVTGGATVGVGHAQRHTSLIALPIPHIAIASSGSGVGIMVGFTGVGTGVCVIRIRIWGRGVLSRPVDDALGNGVGGGRGATDVGMEAGGERGIKATRCMATPAIKSIPSPRISGPHARAQSFVRLGGTGCPLWSNRIHKSHRVMV